MTSDQAFSTAKEVATQMYNQGFTVDHILSEIDSNPTHFIPPSFYKDQSFEENQEMILNLRDFAKDQINNREWG